MLKINKTIKFFMLFIIISVFALLFCAACSLTSPKAAIKITADSSYNENSTPAVVVITKDEEIVSVNALYSGQLSKEVELTQGSYIAKVVCPLNNDGTYYTCNYSNQIDIDNKSNVVEAGFDLSKVEFDKADVNQINEIGKALQDVINKSDGQISQDEMTKFNKNLDTYNQKVAKQKEELAQKQAEEQKAQLAAQFKKFAGNWSAAFPVGGYRGSMTIKEDGTGTLTELSSGTGEYSNNNTPITVQIVTLEAAASSAFGSDSIHFRISTSNGSTEDFIYVAKDDKLCPCSSTFNSDASLAYSQGYRWIRA